MSLKTIRFTSKKKCAINNDCAVQLSYFEIMLPGQHNIMGPYLETTHCQNFKCSSSVLHVTDLTFSFIPERRAFTARTSYTSSNKWVRHTNLQTCSPPKTSSCFLMLVFDHPLILRPFLFPWWPYLPYIFRAIRAAMIRGARYQAFITHRVAEYFWYSCLLGKGCPTNSHGCCKQFLLY
jgi:hypothetical protein